MIRDGDSLRKFENNLARTQPPDYDSNLKIFEALYNEALALSVFPLKNPLDGIDTAIKIARAINHVPRNPGQTGR
jgi:hypothetical protein